MGGSRKIRFTVQYFVPGKWFTPCEWHVSWQGKPTDANLAKDVAHFEAMCKPGAINGHLGEMTIAAAEIVDQRTKTVVATFKVPS